MVNHIVQICKLYLQGKYVYFELSILAEGIYEVVVVVVCVCVWVGGWVGERKAFHIGPLWGESPVSGGFPSGRASNVFFVIGLNKLFSKLLTYQCFEMLYCSCKSHCNENSSVNI